MTGRKKLPAEAAAQRESLESVGLNLAYAFLDFCLHFPGDGDLFGMTDFFLRADRFGFS